MRAVFTPMHEAIGRFCVTPRTNRPRRVLPMSQPIASSTSAAKTMMQMRFHGSVTLLSIVKPPLIQPGFSTPTFCAPKSERTSCCSIRLMPQVASSVSSGRPYRKRITPRSSTAPTSADARNDTGIAATRYQPNAASGMYFWKMPCIT
ncbi:hypothetical protein FQZ97_571210 [compost metagenome]